MCESYRSWHLVVAEAGLGLKKKTCFFVEEKNVFFSLREKIQIIQKSRFFSQPWAEAANQILLGLPFARVNSACFLELVTKIQLRLSPGRCTSGEVLQLLELFQLCKHPTKRCWILHSGSFCIEKIIIQDDLWILCIIFFIGVQKRFKYLCGQKAYFFLVLGNGNWRKSNCCFWFNKFTLGSFCEWNFSRQPSCFWGTSKVPPPDETQQNNFSVAQISGTFTKNKSGVTKIKKRSYDQK